MLPRIKCLLEPVPVEAGVMVLVDNKGAAGAQPSTIVSRRRRNLHWLRPMQHLDRMALLVRVILLLPLLPPAQYPPTLSLPAKIAGLPLHPCGDEMMQAKLYAMHVVCFCYQSLLWLEPWLTPPTRTLLQASWHTSPRRNEEARDQT